MKLQRGGPNHPWVTYLLAALCCLAICAGGFHRKVIIHASSSAPSRTSGTQKSGHVVTPP